MTTLADSSLQMSIASIAVPGVLIGHRLITNGDEFALFPVEACNFARHVVGARRASGSVRVVARELLARLGHVNKTLVKSASGAVIWPDGVVGSLAHDPEVAIAAVSRRCDVAALGIDVEPREILPFDLDLIATPRERRNLRADSYAGRLLFAAKEAVYKAVHPIDNVFLDHHDVEVDFEGRKAVVRGGRIVDLRFCVASHLVALAFLSA
jgi:4'-phosphopantetheinyl transferase EntD